MRVAIYSCAASKDDPHIAEEQIQHLQTIAHQENWEIVCVYRDLVAVPGADRPAYQKMLFDAKQHRFDALFFWALDQLSRQNASNTMLLLHKLSRWEIGFYSCTEKHLDSCHASKDAVTSIIATLVRQNRVYIGEQTRVGIERQKKTQKPGPKGRTGPGRPPITFDQKQATALRLKGKSYTAIASLCGVSKATICRFFKGRERPN
jgi:site-specific DNA recombinase